MRSHRNSRTCILINPPSPLGLSYPSEHLGLGYLAAQLLKEGWHPQIVDAYLRREALDDTTKRLGRLPQPGFVGITVVSAKAWPTTRELISYVCSLWPGVPVVLGGYYATFWHDWILERCPDNVIVVRGEGEKTLSDLAEILLHGDDYHRLPGISFRAKGSVRVNEAVSLVADLDTLPFPTRPTLKTVRERGGFPSMYGSRGCVYSCSFCQVSQFYRSQRGSPYRARSMSNILDEVEGLVNNTEESYVGFVDDEFIGSNTRREQRIRAFCDEIEGRGISFRYGIQCRADNVNRELFARLKETGLRHVYLGIESAVQRSLDLFNKQLTVEDNLQAVRTLEELGVHYTIGLILCDPYTTLDELEKNTAFIRKIASLPLGLNGLNVLRGTPLETQFDSEGLLDRLDGHLDMRPVHPSLRVFRRQLRRYADIYIPVINRLRRLSGHRLVSPNTTATYPDFMSRAYARVKELHLRFLDETVAALQLGDP